MKRTPKIEKNKKTIFMRKTVNLVKASLLALVMATGMNASAQIASPADLDVTGNAAAAVICADGGTFTLTATPADAAAVLPSGVVRNWVWSEVGATAATTVKDGASNLLKETDVATALKPGYHTYRVTEQYKNTTTGEIFCPSPPTEFTVFVLPPMTAASLVDPSGNPSLVYCANSVPTGPVTPGPGAILLTANPTFPDASTFNLAGKEGPGNSIVAITNPAMSTFDLEYKWYKIADGTNVATFDFTAATPLNTDLTLKTYTIAENAVGKFNYVAIVSYKIKPTCSLAKAVVGGTATPAVVSVLAQPAKPTISIN